jgi:acetyl-CoA carboxylase carboxyltransferase component
MSDTTAFPPGDRWERMGVIRHGAKNLHSYANLTCPKVTIVLRRSYGGSNIVMGCSCMGPDFIYGWPTSEFAPTGPEMMVNAVFNKELAIAREEGNFEQMYTFLVGKIRDMYSVMTLGKSFTDWYTVHEVIDPRETRQRIINALHFSADKKEDVPERRRYVKPA